MTISTAANRRATYNGDGSTTAFAFSFKIFAQTDLVVTIKNETTGVLTTKTITTHYTVSGTGNTVGSTNYTSGTVTMLTAPTASEQLIITCSTPIKQETDYVEQDAFYAATHEEALDRLTVICNELKEQIDRGVKADAVTAATLSSTIEGTPTAGYLIAVNDDADGLEYTQGSGAIDGLTPTDGGFLVGDGSAFVVETTSTARSSLGLGTIATQAASSVAITGGSVTGITDLVVADGGTGVSSNTAYAVLCGGTTSTGAIQSIASVGTSGHVLTSNGAGALPTFQAASGGGGMWSYHSAGSVATTRMSFTGLTAGNTYRFFVPTMTFAADTRLDLKVSTDNGSTWIGGAGYSLAQYGTEDSTTPAALNAGVASSSLAYLMSSVQADANARLMLELTAYLGPTDFVAQGQVTYLNVGGSGYVASLNMGIIQTSNDINAISFLAAQNITGVGYCYELVTS